jgi:SAM-dependent methyltransferase
MDVGSADAPSSRWLRSHGFVLSIDRDLESISVGGLCADVARLPVAARSVDVIAAFDVIEHLADPGQALQEFRRVLKRDGVLLLSVPAYEWAWTDLDRQWGHHRRFARGKLTPLLTQQGFDVCRATYVFALTFPLFVAHRMTARHRRGSAGAGAGSKWATVILVAIARLEGRLLSHVNMPFGSSLVAVARVRPQPAPSEWA